MDIHKPKPWHGVREFLKEYLIIVIGVLTALAAEQGVEWLRWQEKVEAANGQMRLELSRAYADAQERIALAPCLDKRITQLEDKLIRSKRMWTPLPPMIAPEGAGVALMHPGRAWDDQFWKGAMADGTVAHMDGALQPKLARIYWQIAMIREWNNQEISEVQSLSALRLAFPLDDGTRVSLLQSLEHVRGRATVIAHLAEPLGRGIRRAVKIDLSMPADVYETSPVLHACRSVGLL